MEHDSTSPQPMGRIIPFRPRGGGVRAVYIPSPLRSYTGGAHRVEAEGATLGAVLLDHRRGAGEDQEEFILALVPVPVGGGAAGGQRFHEGAELCQPAGFGQKLGGERPQMGDLFGGGGVASGGSLADDHRGPSQGVPSR